MQTSTLAMIVVAIAVWADNSAWWTKAIVTAALVVCAVVDIRRNARKKP